MAKLKSFFKKHEVAIVAIATLVFIYLFVAFNQKINFLLGNELILHLTPSQKYFNAYYGNTSKVEFDVSIDNVAYCKAECSYTFNDRSANELINKGIFEIRKNENLRKDYKLSVKRLGSGQDIYSFEVKCHSIRSFLCLTKGHEKFRNSLVTVNYDLTETEKRLKNTLKQNVTKLLEQLAAVDIAHQQLNQKYFELAHRSNLNNLSKQKIDINDAYDKIRISIENLRSFWAVENYFKLNQLFNGSFFDLLENINQSIYNLDSDIDSTVGLHNSLLSKLSELNKNLNGLSYSVKFLNNITNEFDNVYASLTNNTFEDYNSFNVKINDIAKQYNLIVEKSVIPDSELLFNLSYYLSYENNLLCSLRQDCNENATIASTIWDTEKFIDEYPNADTLKQNCNSLIGLSQEFSDARNQSLKIISDANIAFPTDEGFINATTKFKENEIRKINNSFYESFEKVKQENKTSNTILEIASIFLPKNKTEPSTLDNESFNLSLYLLSKLNLSKQTFELQNKCSSLKPEISLYSFEPVIINISYKIVSKIDTNLSDNPPICCVFNDCKPCCRDDSCRNDPKTFPIVFLHGHSFVKDNSPEFSLDSFNKLQAKLEQDGYLNAGIVSLYSKNENFEKGIWGLSGKPVTVKVSYYYDAFRQEDKYIVVPTKSENIDTYALRLKDLIEIIKERTNKPKVNIIAHSMGGLVARRYMQIFGEQEIDKLIMIAAPHNGIYGSVSDFCGIVGENRECIDMQQNSLFLNKLNDALRQPTRAKLYTIIGKGCKMDIDNGDGIVLLENAELKNAKAYIINGTCGGLFESTLHTEILNIDRYPEVYNAITEILGD